MLQTTLDGLLDGGAYALAGVGLTLVFGTLRRVNLAYGAVAMLAAYVGAWLHLKHGVGAAGVLSAMVATAVLAGLYVEWLCFATPADPARPGGAPVAGADGREVVALAASFALWMQLEQLAVNLLPRHLNPFTSLAAAGEWEVAGLVLRPDRLALLGLAVAVTLGLAAWLERSRGGLAWRAASDHRVAAYLAGIRVERVRRVAFAGACALSALAAFAVLSLDGQVTPMFGMWMLVKGLVAAMLGGLGSVRGALAGGLLLGVVEAHAQAAFGAVGREFATQALLFAALVLPWRQWLAPRTGALHGA
jgi:branched-chain amino acid transport system permease protein